MTDDPGRPEVEVLPVAVGHQRSEMALHITPIARNTQVVVVAGQKDLRRTLLKSSRLPT